MSTRTMKRVTLAAVVLIVAAACGQKPGVQGSASAAAQSGIIDPATGQLIDPETGQVIDPQTGEIVGAAGPGAAVDDGKAAGRPGDAGNAPIDSGGAPPTSGDSTGVTSDTIKIGFHDPLTGAAPVPADSAAKGNDLYWKWLTENGVDIEGRKVDSVLRNDNYNPSQAIAVCKEMVEKDGVFLLGGHAGVDQIQACARYAASVGVPYVSSGVTEVGLSGLSNYFALSMTYPDQGPLLADFLVEELGASDEKTGMVRFDTQNFEDAHTAFVDAMDEKGIDLAYDRAVSKYSGTSEAQSAVQEMKAAGLENVYVLTSPVWFIQLLQASRSQDFTPQWVGVGMTMTLDTVTNASCRNGTINGAKFFAPFPAWAERNKFDPDFEDAVNKIYPEKGDGDDVMFLAWGLARALHQMIEAPGRNLTRERFVYFGERVRNLKSGVFPNLSFTPDDHYGANSVHLNEAQCSGYKAGDNRWHTIRSFVSDF